MRKADALARWRQLPAAQNPLPVMDVIPYKTEGSKYGCCGIRIDGTPEFVDAVLSNLKQLLAGENQITRLELSRAPVKPRPGKDFNGGECCYIRLHQRGQEGVIAQVLCRENEAAQAEWDAVMSR